MPLDSELKFAIHLCTVLALYHSQTWDTGMCPDSNGGLVLTIVFTRQFALTSDLLLQHTRGLANG